MERKIVIREVAEPVVNPKPDGRKTDWTGGKVFPAGRYVDDGVSLRRIGAGRYAYLFKNEWRDSSAYDAVVAASVVVEPQGIKEVLASLDVSEGATSVLGLLLRKGLVSRDDIAVAVADLDADNDLYDVI